MRVLGAEMVTDGLEFGVFQETLHDPFAELFAAMSGIDDDVTYPREGGVIGDSTDETDLFAIMNETKTRGVPDAFGNYVARPVIGPVSRVEQSA